MMSNLSPEMATARFSTLELVLDQSGIMDLVAEGLHTADLYNLALTSKYNFANLTSVNTRFANLRGLTQCLCGRQFLPALIKSCLRCHVNICPVSSYLSVIFWTFLTSFFLYHYPTYCGESIHQ